MGIVLNLDILMKQHNLTLNELAEKVGITNVNLSHIKTGKVRALRFSTLETICEVLDCQPADILTYEKDGEEGYGGVVVILGEDDYKD